MIIRILGVLVGLLFIYFAPEMYSDVEGILELIEFILYCSVILGFLVYGIGGQKLLKKIAPFWAEEDDT